MADAIIFTELFHAGDNELNGSGELCLKQLKIDGSEFCLIAYVSAGIDCYPIIYKRGTLADCRQAYKASRADMMKLHNCKSTIITKQPVAGEIRDDNSGKMQCDCGQFYGKYCRCGR